MGILDDFLDPNAVPKKLSKKEASPAAIKKALAATFEELEARRRAKLMAERPPDAIVLFWEEHVCTHCDAVFGSPRHGVEGPWFVRYPTGYGYKYRAAEPKSVPTLPRIKQVIRFKLEGPCPTCIELEEELLRLEQATTGEPVYDRYLALQTSCGTELPTLQDDPTRGNLLDSFLSEGDTSARDGEEVGLGDEDFSEPGDSPVLQADIPPAIWAITRATHEAPTSVEDEPSDV